MIVVGLASGLVGMFYKRETPVKRCMLAFLSSDRGAVGSGLVGASTIARSFPFVNNPTHQNQITNSPQSYACSIYLDIHPLEAIVSIWIFLRTYAHVPVKRFAKFGKLCDHLIHR